MSFCKGVAEAGSLRSPDTSQCLEASREGQRRKAGRGRGLISGWQLHSALSFLISSVALQTAISQGCPRWAGRRGLQGSLGTAGRVGKTPQEYLSRSPQTLPFLQQQRAPIYEIHRRLEKQEACPWLGLLPGCPTGPWEHEDFQSPAGDLLNCCWELPTGSVSL